MALSVCPKKARPENKKNSAEREYPAESYFVV